MLEEGDIPAQPSAPEQSPAPQPDPASEQTGAATNTGPEPAASIATAAGEPDQKLKGMAAGEIPAIQAMFKQANDLGNQLASPFMELSAQQKHAQQTNAIATAYAKGEQIAAEQFVQQNPELAAQYANEVDLLQQAIDRQQNKPEATTVIPDDPERTAIYQNPTEDAAYNTYMVDRNKIIISAKVEGENPEDTRAKLEKNARDFTAEFPTKALAYAGTEVYEDENGKHLLLDHLGETVLHHMQEQAIDAYAQFLTNPNVQTEIALDEKIEEIATNAQSILKKNELLAEKLTNLALTINKQKITQKQTIDAVSPNATPDTDPQPSDTAEPAVSGDANDNSEQPPSTIGTAAEEPSAAPTTEANDEPSAAPLLAEAEAILQMTDEEAKKKAMEAWLKKTEKVGKFLLEVALLILVGYIALELAMLKGKSK